MMKKSDPCTSARQKSMDMDVNSVALSELENFDYNSLKTMFDLPDGSDDEGCGDDDEVIDKTFDSVPPGLQEIQNKEFDDLEQINEQFGLVGLPELQNKSTAPNSITSTSRDQVPSTPTNNLASTSTNLLPSTSRNRAPSNSTNPLPSTSTNPIPSTSTNHVRTNSGNNKKRPTVWYDKDNEAGGELPPFQGVHKCNISGQLPIDYFLKILTPDFMESIVFQTNLYALQKGKENLNFTIQELKVYLGMNFLMTYIKYSRLNQYWSPSHGTRLGLVADHMSYNRFREIKRYLHFINNEENTQDANNKLKKIQPFIEHIRKNFKIAADPECHLSIDEMMVPFKGRSSMKQYIRSKPHKWGFKIWVIAGISGYVYDFEIYQGGSHNEIMINKELGAVANTVLRLTRNFKNVNHVLFFDNLFNSIPLLLQLRNDGIHASGTIRQNRLQGAEKKLKTEKELKKERGSYSIVTSAENITVTRWFDNSSVHVASVFAGLEPIGAAKRWNQKEKKFINIPRPYSIEVYNAHMGGVDLMDSLVGYYRHQIRQKRWYMRIFHHLLDVAVVNCWLLWRKDHGDKDMDLFEFKSSIANSLIFTGSSEVRKRGRPSESPKIPATKRRVTVKAPTELRKDGGPHFPAKTDKTYASKCHLFGCKSKTRYLCGRCKEPLCPECFEDFHSR